MGVSSAWIKPGFLGRAWKAWLPQDYPFFERFLALVGLLIFYIGGYLGIARFNLSRAYYYDVSLRIDSMIPFVPELMPLYALVYVLAAILYVSAPDLSSLMKAAKAVLALSLVCFAFFVLLPIRAEHRPDIVDDGSMTTEIVLFFYWLDAPVNLFPSMHVAMSFLVAWICGTFGRTLGFVCRTLATTVLVCVLVVKQHYVADVIAGLAIAYACYRYLYFYERGARPEGVPALTEVLRRYMPRRPAR